MVRYHRSLGPILMDGSLMKWLISSGHEKELRLLLHLRPSAALLQLSGLPGMDSSHERQSAGTHKTPFELAILLRRDKTLEALLHAAAQFAKSGEPAMVFASKAGKSKKQRADVQLGKGLLPPAMRHVTDCLRDALRSEDHMMAQVLLKFLMTLEPVPFDTPAKFLPRTLETRFLGSPSPSLLLCKPQDFDLNAPLWCQSEGMHVPAGFPSSASVVMLPGLTSYAVLDILAQQEAAFLYTPPVRSLIDALKTNGIQAEFYRQSYQFVVLFLSFIFMVFSLVVDAAPGIDTYSPDKIQRSPRIVMGLVTGLFSFVLAIKFLFNEANELIESTDDVVDIDTLTVEILRMEESFREEAEDLAHLVKAEGTDLQVEQQRTRWMRRSTQRLLPADASNSAKGSVSRRSAFLFGSKYQHPVTKQLERRVRVHPTHDAGVHPHASSADVSVAEKGNGDPSRSSGGGDGGDTGETENCASSPSGRKRKSVTDLATPHPLPGTQIHFLSSQTVCLPNATASPRSGEQAIASIPVLKESAEQLNRCSSMPVAGKPETKGTMAWVARKLQSLDIDVTYFRSQWNWIGLGSFILVLTTCVCYVLGAMCIA